MMRPMLVLWALVACNRPPEAPAELSELAGFLFEHFADEDAAPLQDGVANLDVWLRDHIEDTTDDGYEVTDLREEVLDSVNPDQDHHMDDLAGASVGFVSGFGVAPLAEALLLDEQEDVFPQSYEMHDRTFLTDPDCFMPHTCDFVETDNVTLATYAGLIKVATHSQAEYRWVQWEPASGAGESWAFLQRAWLLDEAEVTPAGLVRVFEQLYVGVTIDWDGPDDDTDRDEAVFPFLQILEGKPSIRTRFRILHFGRNHRWRQRTARTASLKHRADVLRCLRRHRRRRRSFDPRQLDIRPGDGLIGA